MISLKDAILSLDSAAEQIKQLRELYGTLIKSIGDHAIPVDERLVEKHRAVLQQLRQELAECRNASNISEFLARVRQELWDYHDQATKVLESRENEIRHTVGVLADMIAALIRDGETQQTKLSGITKELETVVYVDQITEVRRRLTRGVLELKSCMDTMRRENDRSVTHLQSQLRTFEQQLESTRVAAETDALTGLYNRSYCESKMANLIQNSRRFSILLFDLDRFKAVNDRYGHLAGDLVLKNFARRLRQSTRPEDIVCRWGGDEFLVVLGDCDLRTAVRRSEQLMEICCGTYDLSSIQPNLRVRVHSSVGSAEYRTGETPEALFKRADRFLYSNKGIVLVAGTDKPVQDGSVIRKIS